MLKRSHINLAHYGKKDHKCDSCGKAFSISGNFVKHISFIHNFCGKSFIVLSVLKEPHQDRS